MSLQIVEGLAVEGCARRLALALVGEDLSSSTSLTDALSRLPEQRLEASTVLVVDDVAALDRRERERLSAVLRALPEDAPVAWVVVADEPVGPDEEAVDLAPLTRDEIARWLDADSAEAEAVLRKTSGWPGAIAAFCAARELGRFAREGGDDGDDERVIAELLAAGAAGAAVDGLPRDKVYALGRAGVVVEVGARLVVRDSEATRARAGGAAVLRAHSEALARVHEGRDERERAVAGIGACRGGGAIGATHEKDNRNCADEVPVSSTGSSTFLNGKQPSPVKKSSGWAQPFLRPPKPHRGLSRTSTSPNSV